MKSLQHTSFKTMLQYTPEEIKYFLDLAAKLKADKKAIFRASSQAREATQFLLNALELTSNEEEKLAA